MKSLKGKGLILLSSLFLVACGLTENNGSGGNGENGSEEVVNKVPDDLEENWAKYLQEGNENLDNYGSDTSIDITTAIGDMMADEDSVSITMFIEGDLDKGYNIVEDQEVYFDGDDIFVLENGQWVHYPNEGPIDYPSWYPNIVNSLLKVEDLIEADYSGDKVTLTYDGNDPEVWDAFEQEFALSIKGIQRENINISLEATMDDQAYHLQHLVLDIVGTEKADDVELASVTIFVEANYYDHNEVDFTEVEEKIDEDMNN